MDTVSERSRTELQPNILCIEVCCAELFIKIILPDPVCIASDVTCYIGVGNIDTPQNRLLYPTIDDRLLCLFPVRCTDTPTLLPLRLYSIRNSIFKLTPFNFRAVNPENDFFLRSFAAPARVAIEEHCSYQKHDGNDPHKELCNKFLA